MRLGLGQAMGSNSKDDDDDDDDDVNLNAALYEALKAKDYLLVLDGLVSSTEWNGMLAVLPMGSHKSRVVRITQRDPMEEEGPAAGFDHVSFALDRFGKDDSRELFCRTLRNRKDDGKTTNKIRGDDDDPQMKEYLDSIYGVTGGLPLSVVLLAGLLRTKEFPGEWKCVFDHLTSNSYSESKRDDIIPSMCFDDLPPDLKSCFLYLACIPANMLVKAQTVVCWWMAEGFLTSFRAGVEAEKVGSHYLNELVHRFLINVPPAEHADLGFDSVTVQFRVHDFLLREALEASFVEVHGGDSVPMPSSSVRRLSLQNHSDKCAALATPLPKLRSIISSFEKKGMAAAAAGSTRLRTSWKKKNKEDRKTSARVIRRLLHYSKSLRVIILDGVEIGTELPHEIGKVVHLQHLGINSCSLRIIPASIGKLTRLQTLDVRGTEVSTLLPELWKTRTLRHVFGRLLVLPRRVGYLEQLRTLTAIKPDGADGGYWDRTTCAQTIRLNTLQIDNISTSNVDSLWAIYRIKYLVTLTLSGDVIPSELFTESNLPRLQVLRLDGKITMVPPLSNNGEASSSFTLLTVTKLVLKNTRVPQSFIDQMGEGLRLLSNLVMLEGSYDTDKLVFKSGFQSITYVTLEVEQFKVEIRRPAFRRHLVQLEIVAYNPDLCIDISDKPDIRDKIKIDDKYFSGMAATMTSPQVPKGVVQAVRDRLMAATGRGALDRTNRIHT